MALTKWISKEELKKDFTHYGLFFGLVPVYLGDIEGDMLIATRNGIPDIFMDTVEVLFATFVFIATFIKPDFEPNYAIRITGEMHVSGA